MNTIIASENCTLNHVHNISTIDSVLTPWKTADTLLIEAIVNNGDRERLAQNLPSICSAHTPDGVQVESWMSFLAGRIEWINTDDEQLQDNKLPYAFRIQFPWNKHVVPAIVFSKDMVLSIAKEGNVSSEMLFAFWCLLGLSLACVDPSNLMVLHDDGSFEYRKGRLLPRGQFSAYLRRVEATKLALEYLGAYYGENDRNFKQLLDYLSTSPMYDTHPMNNEVRSYTEKEPISISRTIYSNENKLVQEEVKRVLESNAISGFIGIDLSSNKQGILYIEPNNMPHIQLRLTKSDVAWYFLLMLHPYGFTRRELFTPRIMRTYLTIDCYLHGQETPSDRDVERCCDSDKSSRDRFNKSLQRLRDKLKNEFSEQKGYDYSMFIPTDASSLTPNSPIKIALTALQSPHKIQCYIPEEIRVLLSDSTSIA